MFTLNFVAPIDDVLEIKARLKIKNPSIKSSHLTEAIAQGLGFKTHAALLAQANQYCKITIVSNGPAFLDFLESRQHSASGEDFYVAVAQIAMKVILRSNEKIGPNGYGSGQPQRKPDRSWENAKEHYSRFLASRRELESERSARAFLRSLALLQKVPTIKTVSTKIGSYGIKHIAENFDCTFPTDEQLGPDYVSNGELIVAALHLGLKYMSHVDHLGYDAPNLFFNLSARSLSDLDCAIRPDGARAQDRKRKKAKDGKKRLIQLDTAQTVEISGHS